MRTMILVRQWKETLVEGLLAKEDRQSCLKGVREVGIDGGGVQGMEGRLGGSQDW